LVAVLLNVGASTVGALAIVIIRSLKNVHYTIINGIYGVGLLVVSFVMWLIFRFPLGLTYDFDLY